MRIGPNICSFAGGPARGERDPLARAGFVVSAAQLPSPAALLPAALLPAALSPAALAPAALPPLFAPLLPGGLPPREESGSLFVLLSRRLRRQCALRKRHR